MGNVNLNTSHRSKISKILIKLPNFLFYKTPRIFVSRSVLEWKRETFNEDPNEEWDSALELSFESESVTSDKMNSPKFVRQQRLSYCCNRLPRRDEVTALKEELRILREQVSQLMSRDLKIENVQIPNPPPLPEPDQDEFTINNRCSTPKMNRKDLLKDITNVRLRSVNKSIKKIIPKTPDVRHDLHEILKKRYAAMHSPYPRKFCFNDSEDENRVVYRNDEIFAC